MVVNPLLSVSTKIWAHRNRSTAVTVMKVPSQTSSTTDTNSQGPQVLLSHVKISMDVKSVLIDATSRLTALTQHTITLSVATWISMLTVHQVMTANVTSDTKLIQMVPTPTQVIKDPSVLISINVLLEHITVMNMPNATIMEAINILMLKEMDWYRIWSRKL